MRVVCVCVRACACVRMTDVENARGFTRRDIDHIAECARGLSHNTHESHTSVRAPQKRVASS